MDDEDMRRAERIARELVDAKHKQEERERKEREARESEQDK